MTNKKLIKNIFGWLLAAIILYVLFRSIYIHRDELANWDWRINWLYAALSIITLMGAYLCGSQAWLEIIKGFGYKIKLHESFRVIYMANLGRYIPGKVWQVIGMVGLAKEINVPPQISLASFALAQAFALPASFVLIPLTVGMGSSLASLEVYRDILYGFMGAVVVAFLFLFFNPGGLNWALNKVLKLFRQEPVNYHPDMKNRTVIFLWYILNWTLFGLSFHFFLKALLAQTNISFIHSAGYYITAYVLGYITILSPGGLGVREGVMSALLAPQFGVPVAASISIINRVWITIAEVIISVAAMATYKIKPGVKVEKK
jgi:uncharacterized membrane protein YbhN (UPF0104 family)